MMREGLFEDLPEAKKLGAVEAAAEVGRPRLREPVRDQIELRAVDLDSLIGADHPARVIWAYAEGLNLSELEAAIKSREGQAGHPAIAPRLMLALWLLATSEGIGSARALARLCEHHDAYRWLCGGVSVNYHTLSDFRIGHGALLDRLLVENVAALWANGLIDVSTLSLDGVRVRASAGAASFRRRAKLEQHLAAARNLVDLGQTGELHWTCPLSRLHAPRSSDTDSYSSGVIPERCQSPDSYHISETQSRHTASSPLIRLPSMFLKRHCRHWRLS